jgi:glucose-1-phosphate adenylyltransferase
LEQVTVFTFNNLRREKTDMMEKVVAMVLAGGMWGSLGILAERRAKAAIPFGGIYRIIDFVLSNLMNSDINRVGILTQYKPASLIDHIGIGASWDLFGRTRSVKILPPYKGLKDSDWYKGTADAIYQNRTFISDYQPDYVMVLAGENIYAMNYREVLQFHREKKADCTLVCNRLPAPNPHRFGILSLDDDSRVSSYQEKPATISGDFYSAGIYVFTTEFLLEKLAADAERRNTKHNFADDIIPDMLRAQDRFYGYPFDGYWAYCGNVNEYWQANMDLLAEPSRIDLNAWNIRTNLDDRNVSGHQPALFLASASVDQSLISAGCTISGTVEKSILSPGVIVEKGAIVRNSILFHECVIKQGACVDKVICDKDVFIGPDSQIGVGETTTPNECFPEYLHSGITVIGKDAKLGKGTTVGRNCVIYPGVVLREGFEMQSGGVASL